MHEGDSLDRQYLNTDVSNGTLSLNADGSFSYTPDADWNGTDSFTYTANDGVLDSNVATVTITVNPDNDDPVVTLPGVPVTYYAGGSAVVVDASATVSDVDSTNFNSGDLRVGFMSGGTANDILAIRNQGTGAGEIAVSGSTVSYEGVTIGTFSGGTGGALLDINLNASATPEAVQALARNITYENISATPTTTPRQVRFALRDGDGGQNGVVSQTVNVAINTAPTATNNTVTTNEDTAFTFSAGDFNFSDADGDTLSSVQIISLETVGNLQLSGADVSLNQVISKSDIDAGNLRFLPVADANGVGYDSFGFSVNDGITDSASSYTMTIDVTPVNDIPTAADKTIITPEEQIYTFTVSDFGYNDVEGDPLALVRILPINVGNFIQLDGTVLVTTVVHDIAVADITAGKLTFHPPTDLFGDADIFYFGVNDGTSDSAAHTMSVTVTPVNDAPTLNNGALTTVAEDTANPAGQTVAIIFSGQFSDVDGDSFGGIAVVGNTADAGTQGTWQYSTNGGTNWFAIGTVADDSTALALSSSCLVRFLPVADYNGTPPALTVRGTGRHIRRWLLDHRGQRNPY